MYRSLNIIFTKGQFLERARKSFRSVEGVMIKLSLLTEHGRTWFLGRFQSCYRELFNSFLRGERKEEDEDELIAALEHMYSGF